MLRYILQRLLLAGPVFVGVVTIVFVIVRVLPGDPAQAALGDYAARATVDALRTRLGLDAPLPVQYGRFMLDLARGDLGVSMITGTPIRDQIAYNLPFTIQLTVAALAFGIACGLPLGLWTAVQRDRLPDVVTRIVTLSGVSVPAFFLGVVLIWVFGVQLRWLPGIGGGDPDAPLDLVAHLVLPTLTLGLVMTASVARLTRSALLDVLTQEYVRTARAKGLRERVVLSAHVLRPSLVPIVSLTGLWAVALIGDAVTTELVFARPGLGKMMVGALLQRDYTALQSVMVVFSGFVVVINLVTDLAYGGVDPRIRR